MTALPTTMTSAPQSPVAGHHYTSTGLDSRKVAIWAFIGSECMLFTSLISTYLIYKGRSLVGPFPHERWTDPATGRTFNAILNKRLPKTTTGERIIGNSKLWLAGTALFGLIFLMFQAYEFTSFVHEGLTIRRNLFGSSFFTLTGFHGGHVSAGVIWLLSLLAIDIKRGLKPKDALNVDLAALYWHFVDVVWIAIFTLVYLIK